MSFYVDGVEYSLMTRGGAWGICCNGCAAERNHDLCNLLGEYCTDISVVVEVDKVDKLSLKERSKRHALAALSRIVETPTTLISIDDQINILYELTEEEVDQMFLKFMTRLTLRSELVKENKKLWDQSQ